MSDERTDALDDMLEHAPVEDYSGDDTADAAGTVMQPSDDETRLPMIKPPDTTRTPRRPVPRRLIGAALTFTGPSARSPTG